MPDLTYGFSVNGGTGGVPQTLGLTVQNAHTGTTLNTIEFRDAESVKGFLETMRGLAAVVFPDPQPRGGEPPARDSLWQYERRQESEE